MLLLIAHTIGTVLQSGKKIKENKIKPDITKACWVLLLFVVDNTDIVFIANPIINCDRPVEIFMRVPGLSPRATKLSPVIRMKSPTRKLQ
jgi:hypothetical protein